MLIVILDYITTTTTTKSMPAWTISDPVYRRERGGEVIREEGRKGGREGGREEGREGKLQVEKRRKSAKLWGNNGN